MTPEQKKVALHELLDQLTVNDNFNGLHFLTLLADSIEQSLISKSDLSDALEETIQWWHSAGKSIPLPTPDRIERELVANCSGWSSSVPSRDLRYTKNVAGFDILEPNRSHVTKLNVLLNRHIKADSDLIGTLKATLPSMPLSQAFEEIKRFLDFLSTPEGRNDLIDDVGLLGYQPNATAYPGAGAAWIAPTDNIPSPAAQMPNPEFYLSNRALSGFTNQWMVLYSFRSKNVPVQCRPSAINDGSSRFQVGLENNSHPTWGTSAELDLLIEPNSQTFGGGFERISPPLRLKELEPVFRLIGFVENDHSGYHEAYNKKFIETLLNGRSKTDLYDHIYQLNAY
jgi:hypothetical protein